MKRREELYLVDLIEAACAIAEMIKGLHREAFLASKTNPAAVLWQLMIIGEAAGKLSDSTKQRLSEIPWEQIQGFRNRLVHGYFDLDWEIVWNIAASETPSLMEQAERALAEIYPETHRQWKDRRNG